MPTQVGSYELKTKTSEILRKVEQGERFTITLRGKPVAEIGPIPLRGAERQREIDVAVEGLRNFPRIKGVSGDTVLEMIREGRK